MDFARLMTEAELDDKAMMMCTSFREMKNADATMADVMGYGVQYGELQSAEYPRCMDSGSSDGSIQTHRESNRSMIW